ncbi:MAG: DUF1684 domain-containing protein [Longimicrobiales bacterium]
MRPAAPLALTLLLCSGCADEPWPRPPTVDAAAFVREFNAWRDYRQSRLIAPGPGPVTWIGIWALGPEAQVMGSDSTLPIVLPAAQSPKRVGTLRYANGEVRFEPAAGARILLADSTPVTTAVSLASDRTKTPTTLMLGTLRLRVHGEPGTDRLWLRGWDQEHPARASFRMPETYPPDTTWRVAARFEPFDAPRNYTVEDIVEGTQVYRSTGRLLFRVGKREHRLAAFADPTDTLFFIMMWDSTARSTTYQAGRYMRVPFPDSSGWTMIDFNRAYSPPCVFTPYSTCAFAPSENRLALAVTAGEKRVQ